MPKARHKKTTEYQTSMTKAVFLFGSPNTGKRELLEKIQMYYTDLVNRDIEILSDRPDLTIELVKNDQLRVSGDGSSSAVIFCYANQSAPRKRG